MQGQRKHRDSRATSRPWASNKATNNLWRRPRAGPRSLCLCCLVSVIIDSYEQSSARADAKGRREPRPSAQGVGTGQMNRKGLLQSSC
eukprot:3172572-Alexandrium_andersonii.AAC.1